MKTYFCKLCNYSTDKKNHFTTHLKTQKHNRNLKISLFKQLGKNESSKNFSLLTPKDSVLTPPVESNATFGVHFFGKENETINLDNININDKKNIKFSCQYCSKEFTRKNNLQRHIKHRCKKKLLIKLEKEKSSNYIVNINNNNINNTNNIDKSVNIQNLQVNIKNFGEENLSMLTSKFLKKAICNPKSGLINMIKNIHFNDKYPENKNVRMLNKKDNKLQIMNQGKWEYVNKDDTYRKLIDYKQSELEEFYREHEEKFRQINKKRFEEFIDRLDEDDKKIWLKLQGDIEIIFWNSM